MRLARTLPSIFALPLTLILVHCGTDEKVSPAPSSSASSGEMGGADGGGAAVPDLDPGIAWYGKNRERLDAMIDEHGVNGKSYDPKQKPVAVFDWDNTVIKNDIGDATVFWMLQNDAILQPPGKNWSYTSPYLSPAAVSALTIACAGLAEAGKPLPTHDNAPCADEILSIYSEGTTKAELSAFTTQYDHRRLEPAYAWAAQLLGGHTKDEAHAIADKAIEANLKAPQGAEQTIGTTMGLAAWVRVYDQMNDLIAVLQKNGFDVWVVSASPQLVVERFAARINITADHVVGIRSLTDDKGVLSYDLEGCGDVPDGKNDLMSDAVGDSLIPYIDGKRCWINKAIYGDKTATAIEQTMDPKKRQVFSAGDSNTDITFVKDATALRLVLNRNKVELMCNAYQNGDGNWLVNPMFINPKEQQMTAYPCSTTGCEDKTGAKGACLDEQGAPIPDQMDTVF